jgi:hypothetical protein
MPTVGPFQYPHGVKAPLDKSSGYCDRSAPRARNASIGFRLPFLVLNSGLVSRLEAILGVDLPYPNLIRGSLAQSRIRALSILTFHLVNEVLQRRAEVFLGPMKPNRRFEIF